MTKDDEAFLGGVVLVGGALAINKINNLEVEKRALQNENIMLRNTLSAKDNIIAQLQAELKKMKEEKKGNSSVKSIARSIFDKI